MKGQPVFTSRMLAQKPETQINAIKHEQSKLDTIWDLFKKFTREILADSDALPKRQCIFASSQKISLIRSLSMHQ